MVTKNFIRFQPRVWVYVNKQSIVLFLVLCLWVFGITPLHAHSPTENIHGSASDDEGRDLFQLGATVYKHMCVHCHGADGNGGG